MIRAILLDLGKVIVPFDFTIGYRALQERCGLEPAEIRKRIRETGLVPQFETGLIESRRFVEQLCHALNVSLDYSDFCEIWSSIFARETILPEELILNLKRNYPLILVSNTNAIHFEMIEASYPILRHFDAHVLSYRVKAMKPSPVIYAAAVNAAGCRSEECFFTDDIPEYVEGARQFGIDAVPFTGLEKFEQDLEARGVQR